MKKQKQMSRKEKLIKDLKDLQECSDIESAHGDADDLLLDYINDKEVREAFDNIEKWYA